MKVAKEERGNIGVEEESDVRDSGKSARRNALNAMEISDSR